MFELVNRVAVVTGASRGIGRAIALALSKQGASVAVNYLARQDKADEIVNSMLSSGSKALRVRADVSNKTEVVSMFRDVYNQFGRIDILINNAGVLEFSEIDKIPEDQWDRILDINLKGQFLCAQEAVKYMRDQRWGRIVNITSSLVEGFGFPRNQITHYAASKGGIIEFTKSLAVEVAKHGINVNAIAPGVIDTDLGTYLIKDENLKARVMSSIPVNRVGKTEDVAAATVYLSSPEADYVTGQILHVNGGYGL